MQCEPGMFHRHPDLSTTCARKAEPETRALCRWTVQSLKMVMLIGQAVSLAPAFVMFLFDDDKALGEESDPLTGRPSMPQLGACPGVTSQKTPDHINGAESYSAAAVPALFIC